MHASARALARVDLGAIERNCARLRAQLAGGAQLCAVVKADGYGHGAVGAARAALTGGASWLAVATAGEAEELRRHGLDARILVMGALTREDARATLAAGAEAVVWDPAFLRALPALLPEGAAPARVHLKLDSGMGRLGARERSRVLELADLVESEPRLELVGAMTHFATADEPGDEHFPLQLERFTALARELKARKPGIVLHAANSAAVFRDPASHFDMARCGVAIYGLDPFQGDPAERGLEPALSLSSYVARVERFEPGESAGYGRTWRADGPTLVATLPIGYGDGWRRGLSNRCDVLIRGRRHPLVGTVSMDNVTVDLGRESDVRVGDEAVLIGAQGAEAIRAEEVAARLGTINYEITCGLSPRVRRLWQAAGES
ncbi:MAG: alanine racemase [Thermoleophilaceae bacterium]|nr:alanine racemase [Thermoleophilaceae bacterium]